MYLSIDDVVPIDPDEAGKTVTDYLQDFGQITFFSLIAVAVLTFVIAIVVAKKAGYSGWWGAIAVLVPPLGIILVLLFTMLKWPALKQRDEALGILDQNHLTLPSQERLAIKEAERKRSIEDAARKRMEKAQADREKADVQREKFAASEATRADKAPAVVSATPSAEGAASAVAALPATKPGVADSSATKPSAAKPVVGKPAAAQIEADGEGLTTGASARLASIKPKTPTKRPAADAPTTGSTETPAVTDPEKPASDKT